MVRIETETVIHSDNDFATVAFLRIKEASLEDKPINEDFDLAVPSVLQAKPQMIYEKLQEHDAGLVNGTPPSFGNLVEPLVEPSQGTTTTNENGAWISVSSVQANESEASMTIEEEVRQCFELLLGTCFCSSHTRAIIHKCASEIVTIFLGAQSLRSYHYPPF